MLPETERPTRDRQPPERAPLRAVEAQERGERLPPGARTLLVPMFEARERLDGFLVRHANDPDRSRSEWQKLIGAGAVLVNSRPSQPSKRLIPGERVTILVAPARPERELPRAQEEVPFRVLYADPAMIVLDKPPGVVVHPAPGNAEGTLVNGLLARFPELRDQTGDQRPGIVHRLDKDTSGVMVVGRTAAAVADLQRQMQARQTEKRYLALVAGSIAEDEGLIDRPIARDPRERKRMAVRPDGRPSQTRFWVGERFGDWTLVEAQLLTGRTHQIRVHFASIHRPVAGDRTYGPGRAPAGVRRHFLHASSLRLRSPHDGQERTFIADLPRDLAEPLEALRRRTAKPAVSDLAGWISVAVERLVTEFRPLRVMLFGSRARGDARPDSDVDLLVVMPRLEDKRRLTRAMLQALDDRVVPVDIVVTDPGEIERRGNLVGTVLRPALREGQVLYEQP